MIVGAHPHVLQPIETYKTQDGRDTVIFYSLGNFLSNQSRSYVDGLNPDSNGEPRDEMIGLFSAVKRDYGPAGVRVELGHVGILPVWEDNNRNEMAAGREKKPVIRPVLIDREIPALEARLDALNQVAGVSTTIPPRRWANAEAAPGTNGATPGPGSSLMAQKKEFIEVTEAAEAADGPAGANPGAGGRRLRGGPAEARRRNLNGGDDADSRKQKTCERGNKSGAVVLRGRFLVAAASFSLCRRLFRGALCVCHAVAAATPGGQAQVADEVARQAHGVGRVSASDAGVGRHLYRRAILGERAGAVLVDARECLRRIAARDH